MMIGKIDTNQPPMEPGSTPTQPNIAATQPSSDTDVFVQVKYASLIEKALQLPETEAQRVQQSRDLLLSGQLESPENILEAAENIVKFGI